MGLVGELVDLGNFPSLKISNEPVRVMAYEQTNILKDSTNKSSKPSQTSSKQTDTKPPKAQHIVESIQITNNKKNPSLKPRLVKQSAKSSLVEKNIQNQIPNHRVVKAPPIDLNRTRTFSKNDTIILDVPAKLTRQSRSKTNIKNSSSNLLSRPNSCEKSKAPLPMYHGIKFVPKQKNFICQNSMEKNRSDSLNRFFNRNVNSTPKRDISLNGSNMRSSSGSGLLNTELRAYKRIEYERLKKEKEKMACRIKKELETSRTYIDMEEIKKIRSNSIIRSNPIKLYKPVIVKPSSKPLTNPVSPNFSNRSLSRRH